MRTYRPKQQSWETPERCCTEPSVRLAETRHSFDQARTGTLDFRSVPELILAAVRASVHLTVRGE